MNSRLRLSRSSRTQKSTLISISRNCGIPVSHGLVFAVYLEGRGSAIAKGGRYDNIGAVFGRDRPAALPSTSRLWSRCRNPQFNVPVVAPLSNDPALREAIAALRKAGRVVVIDVPPGVALPDVELIQRDGWVTERENIMSRNVVILGTQWGDEGKGKIVDLLTEQADAVVRQGDAGHTLVMAVRSSSSDPRACWGRGSMPIGNGVVPAGGR